MLTRGDAEPVVVPASAPEPACELAAAPAGARGGGAAPAEPLTRASKAARSAASRGKCAIFAPCLRNQWYVLSS